MIGGIFRDFASALGHLGGSELVAALAVAVFGVVALAAARSLRGGNRDVDHPASLIHHDQAA